MLQSELAREALEEGMPTLIGAVNVLRAVFGHEIDARITMRPRLIEHAIEGELKEMLNGVADDVIKAIETCQD